MHRLHGVHVENQHLVWNDRQRIYYVGPDSEFRDSQIDIVVPRAGLILVRTRFVGCTIRFKRPMNEFRFDGARFENCRLTGRFSSCDFGRRDDEKDFPAYFPEAGIVDTDLSQARLDGCRFINCDLSTVELPRWPCFTIRDPEAMYEHISALPWPAQTRFIVGEPGEDPPNTAGASWDARDVCKQFGGTVEELRAVVAQIPGVIM